MEGGGGGWSADARELKNPLPFQFSRVGNLSVSSDLYRYHDNISSSLLILFELSGGLAIWRLTPELRFLRSETGTIHSKEVEKPLHD